MTLSPRAPDGAPAEQAPEMLQNLLALRFRMRVHWGARQKDVYSLVTGNKSLKLTSRSSLRCGIQLG
jgi:uncharacterized protein (TIGR03435 family)